MGEYIAQILPSLLIVVLTVGFFLAERRWPGRPLPERKGWYARALLLNFVQVSMMGIAGLTWNAWFREWTIIDLGDWAHPVLQGFAYWFALTFVFYWWHRLRHANGWWHVFHQIHHSPSRIEVLTAFYKHPIEIAFDSALGSFFLYSLAGASGEVGAWYAFFAAAGEFFYHANLKTPDWMRYLIQTPELHSVHHQLDLHDGNFADLPLWDRLFGTYRDATEFEECGFPGNAEAKLGDMLLFRDVYESDRTPDPAE